MKAYGGMHVQIHIFLTSALAGWVVGFTPRPLYPWAKSPRYPWIGGWVDPRAGLDDVEKFLTIPGLELWTLGRPARSQSLYRLRYPGSHYYWLYKLKTTKLRWTPMAVTSTHKVLRKISQVVQDMQREAHRQRVYLISPLSFLQKAKQANKNVAVVYSVSLQRD
jgi:hypothetical protein